MPTSGPELALVLSAAMLADGDIRKVNVIRNISYRYNLLRPEMRYQRNFHG